MPPRVQDTLGDVDRPDSPLMGRDRAGAREGRGIPCFDRAVVASRVEHPVPSRQGPDPAGVTRQGALELASLDVPRLEVLPVGTPVVRGTKKRKGAKLECWVADPSGKEFGAHLASAPENRVEPTMQTALTS